MVASTLMVTSFIYAGAFVLSVAATAWLVWRGFDDVVADIRRAPAYSLDWGAPCLRCRKRLRHGETVCPRCRLRLSYRELRVAGSHRGYAMAENLDYGKYLETVILTTDGQRVAIIAPVGPVARAGDHLDLVFDRRKRLRAFHNVTLSTGWRLPVHVIGQRSPVAMIGLLLAVPATTVLILLAPAYFLFETMSHSYEEVARALASGARHVPDPSLGSREIAALALYLLGLALFGCFIAVARGRPRLNRDIFR